MRINKVTSSGLNRLLEAYKSTMVDNHIQNKMMTFSSKSNEFFETLEVSLFLSEIKGIELLALRRFCPSLIILDNDGKSFTDAPKQIKDDVLRVPKNKTEEDKNREKELNTLSETLPSYLKYLASSFNIDNPVNLYGMFDIGSYRFKAIARFEGVAIVSLFDAFPEHKLFDKSTGGFFEEGSKGLENLCAKQFVKNFYQHLDSSLGVCDVLTDVRFMEEFFKYLSKDNPCFCTHIRNPLSEISMMNYHTSQELISSIKDIKVQSNFNGYNLKPEKDFIYNFAVTGNFDTLLKFLAYSNLVYHYDDLKAVIGTKSSYSPPDGVTSQDVYQIYVDGIKALDEYRLSALKLLALEEKSENKNQIIHYSKLELYNFIPRGSKINFMIRGNRSELMEFVNGIRENRSTLINSELEYILKNITNQINLIEFIYDKN